MEATPLGEEAREVEVAAENDGVDAVGVHGKHSFVDERDDGVDDSLLGDGEVPPQRREGGAASEVDGVRHVGSGSVGDLIEELHGGIRRARAVVGGEVVHEGHGLTVLLRRHEVPEEDVVQVHHAHHQRAAVVGHVLLRRQRGGTGGWSGQWTVCSEGGPAGGGSEGGRHCARGDARSSRPLARFTSGFFGGDRSGIAGYANGGKDCRDLGRFAWNLGGFALWNTSARLIGGFIG